MEKVKQIIVTNIGWDAPKSAGLPKKVVIDINEDNKYLLENIDGYADEFINTIKLIFQERVKVCEDCDICNLYKSKQLNKL